MENLAIISKSLERKMIYKLNHFINLFIQKIILLMLDKKMAKLNLWIHLLTVSNLKSRDRCKVFPSGVSACRLSPHYKYSAWFEGGNIIMLF